MGRTGTYSASKHGIMALTKSLADEGKPYHIKVSAICPGAVADELVDASREEILHSEKISPFDIAETAIYLATLGVYTVVHQIVGIGWERIGEREERMACWFPVLAQRAVSEDPCWTRAVGDQSGHPRERKTSKLGRIIRGGARWKRVVRVPRAPYEARYIENSESPLLFFPDNGKTNKSILMPDPIPLGKTNRSMFSLTPFPPAPVSSGRECPESTLRQDFHAGSDHPAK